MFSYSDPLDFYWWNSTDYRNKFSGDIGFGYDAIPEFDSRSYQIRWAPRYRVNNHLFMTYVISHKLEHNNVGRAFDSNYTNLEDEQGNILFSKRKRKTITIYSFLMWLTTSYLSILNFVITGQFSNTNNLQIRKCSSKNDFATRIQTTLLYTTSTTTHGILT